VHRIASPQRIHCLRAQSRRRRACRNFLICEGCGVVGEASSPAVTATLTSAAKGVGVIPSLSVIEILTASAPIAPQAGSACPAASP
jgi:Fur family zinc uptake transcriptional regulator